jgi:hypothetical protein
MRKTELMSEQDFNQLFQVKNFEDMTDSELDVYTEIFIEKVRAQFESDEDNAVFWCPKCETLEAVIEIDRLENRAVATCGHCRMAVVVMASEIE